MKICNIPAILASYANPTPQTLLLATPDITPAQLLPCLSREIVLKLVEITDVSQMQQAVGLDKCNNGHNWNKRIMFLQNPLPTGVDPMTFWLLVQMFYHKATGRKQ